MKKKDLKLTPKELKKKQQYRAKWCMIKPTIFILLVAIVIIIVSYILYIFKKCYLSDLSMSIGGGIIAGMVVYVLGNIKQKNIIQNREQSIEINKIMETFIMIKSLVVRILKMPEELLFFSEKCYYLPENISNEEAIKQLKKCFKIIEDIDVNQLTILKYYNDLYNCLENYYKQELYKNFNNINGEEFINKLQSKKDLLLNTILEIEFNSKDLKYYIENIGVQIL